MHINRFFLPFSLLAAMLQLNGCASSSPLEESRAYSAVGQHFRAFHLVDAERERALARPGPVSRELETAWDEARRAFLLDRARRYIFLEYEEEALVDLAALEAVEPDHPEIPVLRERATYKLALRAAERGQELLRNRLLTEAMAAFLEAETILPTLPEAHAGQQLVRAQVERLTYRAQMQFLEAVRKLPQFRYAEVRWHSSNAIVNDPDRQDAEVLRERAQRELAIASKERGDDNRQQGNYGAALIEYQSARKRDPELAGIDDLIAEMERELAALKLAETAQMRMRQLRFDEARDLLDEAFAMSVQLRADITELMIQNRRLEGERDYTAARDFEIQGKKREALEAFVLLSAKWPDGLEDEKARIEVLQSDIESARKEWELAEAAEAAGDLAKALEHYEASNEFYERMADAKARIARLKKQIADAEKARIPDGN